MKPQRLVPHPVGDLAEISNDTASCHVPFHQLAILLAASALCVPPCPAGEPGSSTWPQACQVERDAAAHRLSLNTPYYSIAQDLTHGGAISRIHLTFGQASNLLAAPIQTRIRTEQGFWLSDSQAPAGVSERRDGLAEVVTTECDLRDEQGRPSKVHLKTVTEYRWGYLRIHKELTTPEDLKVLEVEPLAMVLDPSLYSYGYREGKTEAEGAPAFFFGSNRWGELRRGNPADQAFRLNLVPRSLLFANPGVEGLEWFVSSDLGPWELGLTGKRGQGRCVAEWSDSPAGIRVTVSTYCQTNPVAVPKVLVFDYRIGIPLKTSQTPTSWLHSSFNRNQGNWVSPEQVRQWAADGIQTVHCHNDGDYYGDGLFWHDGAYPPYPDMDKYDHVIALCHQAGIRVATYFSNKELHPSTREYQEHGPEWGRMNAKGRLEHNFFNRTNEFGAQMCLRSGWLDYLKLSIKRVLGHHALDGVYYDWNVSLLCQNPQHHAKDTTVIDHWDVDELLDLMEWTRQRVGPHGLVIVHNTTTPMFATENFADDVVANEWGYGKFADQVGKLEKLPLEWSFVGARARGVISYGQIDAAAPRTLHQQFALEAFLSGVSTWPASPDAVALAALLKPVTTLNDCRFLDWRNKAVVMEGLQRAAAVYSRPGEAYVLVANLAAEAQEIGVVVKPGELPFPLQPIRTVTILGVFPKPAAAAQPITPPEAADLTAAGGKLMIPGAGMVLLRLK